MALFFDLERVGLDSSSCVGVTVMRGLSQVQSRYRRSVVVLVLRGYLLEG